MRVTVLGSGGPLPDPARAGPATLVQVGSVTLLVDCGRGVLMRLAAAGAGVRQLSAVLLTHLHSDHVTDLGDIVTTHWITSFRPEPLRIVGPARTREVVDGVLASLGPDIEYRIAHHDDLTWRPVVEAKESAAGQVFESDGVVVRACETEHKPASPSLAYRVEHDGRAVVVAGDTVPCDALDSLCAGASMLVHTAIRADLIERMPVQRLRDVCDYHSSVEHAAQTAARAGVETLVLVHGVPPIPPGGEREWHALASAHFGGHVEVAADLYAADV